MFTVRNQAWLRLKIKLLQLSMAHSSTDSAE